MTAQFNFQSNLMLTVLSIFILSCNNEETPPSGEYATGVVVVNEGNFSDSDGSFDFYKPSEATVSSGIYGQVNGVQTSGLFQSIYFHEQSGYLVDQKGSKITRVDAETFEYITDITDELSTPRYMVVANGKGYVSNWGAFDANFNLPNSFVAVIDLSDNSTIKTIAIGDGAEGLTVYAGNVFVANSYSNTIQEINTETDEVAATIEIADAPLGFVEDSSGKHWILSSSFITGVARLTQIDLASGIISKSFEVAGSAKSLNIDGPGSNLYYLSAPFGAEARVYTLPITASAAPAEALLSESNLYGIGVDPDTGELYVANHNAFQGNGTIQRYNVNAELIDTFAAGRAPSSFAFR